MPRSAFELIAGQIVQMFFFSGLNMYKMFDLEFKTAISMYKIQNFLLAVFSSKLKLNLFPFFLFRISKSINCQ